MVVMRSWQTLPTPKLTTLEKDSKNLSSLRLVWRYVNWCVLLQRMVCEEHDASDDERLAGARTSPWGFFCVVDASIDPVSLFKSRESRRRRRRQIWEEGGTTTITVNLCDNCLHDKEGWITSRRQHSGIASVVATKNLISNGQPWHRLTHYLSF